MTVMNILHTPSFAASSIGANEVLNPASDAADVMAMANDIADYDTAIHITACASEFLQQTAETLAATAKDGGINASCAAVLANSQELLRNIAGFEVPVLASEDFGQEGERGANTVLAAESFVDEAKAGVKRAYAWVIEQLKKFKAFIMRLFDAAPRLAKAAKAVKEKAQQAQSDGKTTDDKKVSLSSGQVAKLATGNQVGALGAGVKLYQTAVNDVFGTYLPGVASVSEQFETMVGSADTAADNSSLINAYISKVNSDVVAKAPNDSNVYLGNMKFTKPQAVAAANAAASNNAVTALSEVQKVKVTFTKDTTAKPKDSQEYSMLTLNDIEGIADAIADAAETIATAKDKANKGNKAAETIEKALKTAQKLVDGAGDSDQFTKQVSKMAECGRSQATWLNNPTAVFSGSMLTSLSAALDVCKSCLGKYKTK